MTHQYRRLAVFVDRPGEHKFLWLVLESTDDPAVWLDLETGDELYSSWIEAHEAGNLALLRHVDDKAKGPLRPVTTDADVGDEQGPAGTR